MWPFRRNRDADLDAEIRAHLEMAEHDRIDRGERPEDARARARREFGNVALVKDTARDMWRFAWLDVLARDLRHAVRGWRRDRGVAIVAILALGAAIGLNASVFTTFNTIFLSRWPVRDAARVVQIRPNILIGESDYRQLAGETKTLSGLVASTCEHCRVRVQGRTLRLNAVSANYFSVFGVSMALGRGFGASEEPSAVPAAVAILGHRLWRNDFAADPDIVGTRVELSGVPFVVVGVAAREFTGITIDDAPELWIPLSAAPLVQPAKEAFERVRIDGRLADGVSRASAHAELAVLVGRMRAQADPSGRPVTVRLDDATYVEMSKLERMTALGLTTIAVLLVLLLACANVGNLLLARGAARTREMATRLALGASRGRLLRQLLAENGVLAGAACALGVALSFVLPQLVIDRMTALSERPQEFAVRFVPDLTVILFACALAALSVVAFGLTPALLASRQSASAAMKEEGGALRVRLGPRRALLVVQVAVSAMLLASAGLITRSVRHALDVDLGFDLAAISEVSVESPPSYTESRRLQSAQAFFDLIRRSRQEGSTHAAIWAMPFGWGTETSVARTNAAPPPANATFVYRVTPNFFDVMRIPILAGRAFGDGDDTVLVSERLATDLFPGESAVGRTVLMETTARQIVGVVKDADLAGSSFMREFKHGRPAVYEQLSETSLAARALIRHDQAGQLDGLRAIAAAVDPGLTLRTKPLTTTRDQRLEDSHIGAGVAGLVGLMALAIATVGIYGVFAYLARQRTREIGIRVALGAQSSQVLRDVFGGSARALAIGVAVGLAAAALVAPLLRGFVHPQIGRIDPWTTAGVTLLVCLAGIGALFGPARRASRVDPVQALKVE